MTSVGVVVTHFTGQDYLDLCLNSLLQAQGVELEIVVASSALTPPKVDPRVKLLMLPRSNSNVLNCNIGFLALETNPKYMFTCNDDIIVPINSIKILADVVGSNRTIISPLSNCDVNWLYFTQFLLESDDKKTRLTLPRFFEKETIEGFHKSILELDLTNQLPLVVPTSFLCMYATMMHYETWKDLDGYDVTLTCGADVDFCIRAHKKRYSTCWTNIAFVLHFGGIVTKNMPQDRRDAELKIFMDKYKFHPEAYRI